MTHWLSIQNIPLKSFWRNRKGNLSIAGLGQAWEYRLHHRNDIAPCFRQISQLLKNNSTDLSPLQCLGFIAFSDQQQCTWESFGYGHFFLPAIELRKNTWGYQLACHLFYDNPQQWQTMINKRVEQLSHLDWSTTSKKHHSCALTPAGYIPDETQWQHLMTQSQQAFRDKQFRKVVLSRESRFSFDGTLSPWEILRRWHEANPYSYTYAFQETPGHVFFGCSPESLFHRRGLSITTEALAGTISRGTDRYTDQEKADYLLSDPKNITENRLVLDDIKQRLNPVCTHLKADKTHSLLKLKNLQHLRYLIRGRLIPDVKDEDLIRILHPTPAIGGLPREQAMAFIHREEPYARGLYAGICGIVGLNDTELNVSIRCARLAPGKLSLYSGAGIIPASRSLDEWEELDNKISTIRHILHTICT